MASLLPHAGPMRLVARVREHAPDATVCEVEPAASGLFADADGRIPAFLALEYMAQTVAVHGGLLARAAGTTPGPGLLLGARRLALHVDAFAPDEPLLAEASPRSRSGDLASFACRVCRARDGALLAEATVNLFVPEAPDALLANPRGEPAQPSPGAGETRP